MSPDLNEFRLFVHAIESGGITKGAETSHLALSLANARICGMEDALKVEPLMRGRHGVRLPVHMRANQETVEGRIISIK